MPAPIGTGAAEENDLWQLDSTPEEAAHLGGGCWKIRDALPN